MRIAVNFFCGTLKWGTALFFSFFLVSTVGCQPKESSAPVVPSHPESLTPKGEADELENALEDLINRKDQAMRLAAAKCPEKVLEFLPGGLHSNSECGGVKVPENHRNPSQKSMVLAYLKVPKVFDPSKPLLVIEQGGPGGSSMTLASTYLSDAPLLSHNFNVLAIEQRGTAWTRPKATCDTMIDAFIEFRKKNISFQEEKRQPSKQIKVVLIP